MTKVTLKIIGDHQMNCGGCEGNVKYTLSQVPGVTEVSASNQTQLVEVASNTEISVETLQTALLGIGYQAELV
jgi:copper chaperone CopZ